MTYTRTTALAAIFAAGAVVAAPAAAQVNGIATADTAIAIASTQALQTGYHQISTQYEAQRQTLDQRQQQRQQLAQQLDTNGDGQLSEAEGAAAPDATVQQIQTLDQEIAQIQAPIQRARIYVVGQIAQQYSAAVQQVIAAQNIQLLLAPEAVLYRPDSADVTQAIITSLNTLVPAAQVVPPEGWQPNQSTVNLFQQVQQLLVMSALQQQQAAQQQGAASGAAPKPAPVEGR